MAETKPMETNNTRTMEKMCSEDRLQIFENIIFSGNNGQYEVLADNQIGFGGESVVYMARRMSDGECVVAKIYDEFQDTRLNRINRQKAINFALSHSNYKETHILPLLDYGMIDIKTDLGEDFRKPIDILPFCQNGELKKENYTELKEHVIPGILQAIHLMHQSNIVHRDIKPGNIYRYDGEIVIADFGTACEILQKADFVGTRTKRGTLGYTAPEVWQGYAVTASDYFSIGCTIASLYKGEHVYQRLIDLNDSGAIHKAINSNGLPLDCPDQDKPLQSLVNALAAVDESKRANYDDVLLWLNDPAVFERKFKYSPETDKAEGFSFHFEDTICHNKKELIDSMVAKWDIAKDYLYRGGVKNSTLVNLFSPIDQALAIRIGEIIDARATATNYDLGLAQALHYIEQSGPMCWKGQIYQKISDISTAISDKRVPVEEIAKMLQSKYVSWKLEKTNGVMPETLEAVKEIEELSEVYPQLAAYCAMFRFMPEGTEMSYHGIKEADGLFAQIATPVSDFYQKSSALMADDELWAYIAACGYTKDVIKFKSALNGKKDHDLELLYRLLEAICADKSVICDHYLKYGPESYLFWLKNHLALYEFRTSQAKLIRDRMENVDFSTAHSVNDIASNFAILRELKKDFLTMFQNNILLAYLGIGIADQQKDIVSNNSDAFFVEEFCGNEVPVGYMRYIQTN